MGQQFSLFIFYLNFNMLSFYIRTFQWLSDNASVKKLCSHFLIFHWFNLCLNFPHLHRNMSFETSDVILFVHQFLCAVTTNEFGKERLPQNTSGTKKSFSSRILDQLESPWRLNRMLWLTEVVGLDLVMLYSHHSVSLDLW